MEGQAKERMAHVVVHARRGPCRRSAASVQRRLRALKGRPWRASIDLIQRADAVLNSVGLSGKRDALASALPHGDQRKLEVAMMMALEPKIYMFDEPTAGMSVDEVPVMLDLIARLKTDATKTILLVEHKMDVVRSLADRIIVLINGQLAADGDPATVIASPSSRRPISG